MKNVTLKYLLITLSFLVVLQTISAESFKEAVNNESSINFSTLTARVVQADIDDLTPLSLAVFQSTFQSKHFFNCACHNGDGIILNPGSRALANWVKVKLQV